MRTEAQLRAYIEKKQLKLEQHIRATAFKMNALIVQDTPVDEGTAKNNWQATLNTASNDFLNAETPGRIDISDFKLGDTIYFVNNLKYIRFLEYGGSDQAPSGMLRKNIKKMAKAFKEL